MSRSDTRYTTFVTTAKIVLPLVAIGLLASLFLISGGPEESQVIPYSEVELTEILQGQRLGTPTYRGTLTDGSDVVVEAERAQPRADNRDIIDAEQIDALLTGATGNRIDLSAGRGSFDQSTQMATGSDGVVMEHSDGYRLETDALTAFIDRFEIATQALLTLTGPGFELQAGRATITRATGEPGTEVLDFTDGVHVLYTGGE